MAQIDNIPLNEIIPYNRNPRQNDNAVEIVARSIKEFGFQNPIILDKDNVIIAGHTRYKAAKMLGLTEVPVLWAENLTSEQVKAYRIMDNKSGEIANWDMEALQKEINELKDMNFDLDLTGFNKLEISSIEKMFEPTDDDQGALDKREKITCPNCGHDFVKWG